jgi:hypothetical protein
MSGKLSDMLPAGYLYKRTAVAAAVLTDLPGIEAVYSLSHCMAPPFINYIEHWMHNGFWLFDTPSLMQDIAGKADIDLDGMTLFYYEIHQRELNDASGWSPGLAGTWSDVLADDFPTAVQPPTTRHLEGFDVVCHMTSVAGLGCSPLSCNGVAKSAAVNSRCLFDTLEQAISALDAGLFANTEPGSKRIFAVYTVSGHAGTN